MADSTTTMAMRGPSQGGAHPSSGSTSSLHCEWIKVRGKSVRAHVQVCAARNWSTIARPASWQPQSYPEAQPIGPCTSSSFSSASAFSSAASSSMPTRPHPLSHTHQKWERGERNTRVLKARHLVNPWDLPDHPQTGYSRSQSRESPRPQGHAPPASFPTPHTDSNTQNSSHTSRERGEAPLTFSKPGTSTPTRTITGSLGARLLCAMVMYPIVTTSLLLLLV